MVADWANALMHIIRNWSSRRFRIDICVMRKVPFRTAVRGKVYMGESPLMAML